MRRDPDHFCETELQLVYIAARLEEAQALESLLSEKAIDYLVETDTYSGGIIFRTSRVGAFFYVRDADLELVRAAMRDGGYRPYKP